MQQDTPILEFTHTDTQEATAQAAGAAVGKLFFTYNFPLQISFCSETDDDGNETGKLAGHILNYMPRKECCSDMDFLELFGKSMPTKEEFRAFCDTTICILDNLKKQWEEVRDGKRDMIYYPNCSDLDPKDENLNPFKKA